jgi:hypothetical protein
LGRGVELLVQDARSEGAAVCAQRDLRCVDFGSHRMFYKQLLIMMQLPPHFGDEVPHKNILDTVYKMFLYYHNDTQLRNIMPAGAHFVIASVLNFTD